MYVYFYGGYFCLIVLQIGKFMVMNYPMTSFKKSVDFIIQGKAMKQ